MSAGDHPATGVPVAPAALDGPVLHVGSRIGVHHVTAPIDPYEAQGHHATPDVDESGAPQAGGNSLADLLVQIAEIPHSVWAMQRELKALLDLLAVSFTPRPYANLATLSGSAGTTLGTTTWAVAIPQSLSQQGEIEVVDCVLSNDSSARTELRAVAATDYSTAPASRLLGTVEIGQTPTVAFPTPLVLHPGEALILVIYAPGAHCDFSCRYRYQRS